MGHTKVNSLIMQNRLLSQARSRSRSQSTNMGKALQKSSNGNGKSSLLNSIKKQADSDRYTLGEADLKSKKNYTAMREAAESLSGHTAKLLLLGKKDLEELTEEELTGLKESTVLEAASMVESYNEMIRAMTDEGGTVNEIYLKQMKGYFKNAKSDLEALGITQSSDGTLSVNTELLKGADIQKLVKTLGMEGSFTDDIGKRAQNVISNAETNLAVLNKSQYAGLYSYNQYGNDILDAFTSGGKYNTRG